MTRWYCIGLPEQIKKNKVRKNHFMTRSFFTVLLQLNCNIKRGNHNGLFILVLHPSQTGIWRCWWTDENQRKTLGVRQEPTTNSIHIWHQAGIKPRPHWWKASTLATAPFLPRQLINNLVGQLFWFVKDELFQYCESLNLKLVITDFRQNVWLSNHHNNEKIYHTSIFDNF